MSQTGPRVFEVDRLTAYVKALIEEDPLLNDLWVRGEVTNFTRSSAGHCYFSMTHEGSQIRCVLFRHNQRGILVLPSNGEVVLAHGRLGVYEASGQYQLYVDNVAPEGAGLLQLQFEELRRRLESEGLFAQERKRALPVRPAAIGVVTSPTGAVWHDIQTVTARRYPLTKLVFAPAAVQGTNAPGELISSLRGLQEHPEVDVIIIGRGGGSAEDLAAFNDEHLARAIYACSVPVVSAVGHETDTSIADLVADIRAATPSAAAELCVPDQRELIASINRQVSQVRNSSHWRVQRSQQNLAATRATIGRISPRSHIASYRLDIDRLSERALATLDGRIGLARTSVERLVQATRLLDPRDVLRRGFAIVSTGTNGIEHRVTSADAAATAGDVQISFSDGSVNALVRGTRQ